MLRWSREAENRRYAVHECGRATTGGVANLELDRLEQFTKLEKALPGKAVPPPPPLLPAAKPEKIMVTATVRCAFQIQ